MQIVSRQRLAAASAVACLLLTACDAPESLGSASEPDFAAAVVPSLMVCAPAPATSARGMIHPQLGGVVAAGGNRVLAPIGAVSNTTEIGILAPSGQHVRVELSANGQEHWQFLDVLTVTIDYSHCHPSSYAGRQLSVWLIDSQTGALLQPMGGIDDRPSRRITFLTDHFSGYAIAN